jgi:hypothetical protein
MLKLQMSTKLVRGVKSEDVPNTVFVYMCDWGRGHGATTPSHLILYAGPLCTTF